MRVFNIGDVLVVDGNSVVGILTDRDIVIRAIAADLDPGPTMVGDVASPNPVRLGAEQPAADAVQLMRDHALRRLPVVQDGRLVGVLSLGNLAIERDPESALADISEAPPDQ
jgi:CBS domain-containing protein